MGTSIEHLFKEIEQKIGDPEKAIELNRDLETLKTMMCPTDFYIKGKGTPKKFRLSHSHDSEAHRFIASSFESMRDGLIDRYLPRNLRNEPEDAQKAWALLFLHRILRYNKLGDPSIWDCRVYTRTDPSNLEESLIFLRNGDFLKIEFTYQISLKNRLYNFSASSPTWKEMPNELRKQVNIMEKECEDAIMVFNKGALPSKIRRDAIKILNNTCAFLSNVREYAGQLESQLKKPKEENAEVSQ